MKLRDILAAITLFASLSSVCFGQSLECSNSENGTSIQFLGDGLDEDVRVASSEGEMLYRGSLSLDTIRGDTYYYSSFDTDFVKAIGLDDNDIDTISVEYNFEDNELIVSTSIGGSDRGWMAFDCL